MSTERDILSFVAASFRSIWAIEILRFLAGRRDARFSPADLIAELRVSDSVVSQSVATLSAAGLVTEDNDGQVQIFSGDEKLNDLVAGAIALYESSPNKVRRTIVSGASPGITAFVDAFRMRRD